eukprot:768749-Hanusia_phi.AAC.31
MVEDASLVLTALDTTHDGLLTFVQRGGKGRKPGVACDRCHSLKIKCDDFRPCKSCVRSGLGPQCHTTHKDQSCLNCRKSKLKCDKGRPCDRCTKRGLSGTCQDTLPAAAPDISCGSPEDTRSISEESSSSDLEMVSQSKRPHAILPWEAELCAKRFKRCDSSDDEEIRHPNLDWLDSDYFPMNLKMRRDQYPNFIQRLNVERPLQTNTCINSRFHPTLEVTAFSHMEGLMSIYKRFFAAGYNSTQLLQIFNNLPLHILSIINEGVIAMHKLSVIWKKYPRENEASSRPCPQTLSHDSSSENGLGYFTISWDQQSSARTFFQVNHNAGMLLNVHPEEIVARFGNCDFRMPLTDLEFLAQILSDVLNFQNPKHVTYARLALHTSSSNQFQDALFVRVTRYRLLDSVGIESHKRYLEFVSPEEFERVRLSNPER